MSPVELLHALRDIQDEIRDAVVASCEQSSIALLSEVAAEAAGDTIYAIDRVSEERLEALVESRIAVNVPVILIAEGLPGNGEIALPRGVAADQCEYRLIVDPIDGTRGLMYQKRSAWILSGLAPNKGDATTLQDIFLSVMTEIPLVKQHLSDQLWAIKGEGAAAQRYNRITGDRTDFSLSPSRAQSIAHGFAMISRFFPGRRDLLAAIDEDIITGALGSVTAGKALCFEDQYISTGGQLYELLVGHDRFNADLRPLLEPIIARQGLELGICCHPYDCASFLIAEEAGIAITDAQGDPVNAPLNLEADVVWAAYANPHIRQQIEPLLKKAIATHLSVS